ncbi:hypothetical protein AB0G74_05340 [Streptomyces sp. NPDC020875]|uniref:hypothetical protein n=1 Tax=Streptomyces sp. NPDC020875 TaxID=3154898 RepID=UPI003405964D
MRERPSTGTGTGRISRNDPPDPAGQQGPRRLDLSVPQVAGSALAAVTAAVLASRLGVYGTIIGAGVVSVVATCGGSVFQHLFSRTGDQLRGSGGPGRSAGRHPEPSTGPPLAPEPGPGPGSGEFGAATTHGSRIRGWRRPAAAAAVVFGVAMAGITGYEVLSGSGLDGGGGTTVGTVVRGGNGGDGSGPAREDREPSREQQRPETDRGRDDGPDDPGSPPAPPTDPERTGDGTTPAPEQGGGTPEPPAGKPAPAPSGSPGASPGPSSPGTGSGAPGPASGADGGGTGRGAGGDPGTAQGAAGARQDGPAR